MKGKIDDAQECLIQYQKERPEIKTIDDYKGVAPDLNNEIKELMIEGMRLAGMPE